MNFEEAREILRLSEVYEDRCCTCFQGNAPCSYCENCPSKELVEEARQILGDNYE